jgi:hypothetical protein
MWLLLIVLLAPPPGIDRVTVLKTFATYEACQPERDRIGFEMAESYPYESDFRIVCEFRERQPSKVLLLHVDEERSLLDRVSNRPSLDTPLSTLRQASE